MSGPVPVQMLVQVLFLGLLLLAAIADLGAFRIPNRVSAAIATLYPAHVAASPTPVDWPTALLVAALVLVVGFALFTRGVIGGGDAKLIAAVALWAGPSQVLAFLLVTAVAGGGLGLVLLSPHRFAVAHACARLGLTDVGTVLLGRTIPYALAIALGGWIAVGVPLVRAGV